MLWNDRLATGNAEIDGQHRTLCDLIDRLGKGCGPGLIDEALDFLADYAKQHFAAEEKLMLDHGFSGFSRHRSQHVMLLHEVALLRAENRNATDACRSLHSWLEAWLRNHILAEDIPMVKALQ